MAKAAKAAGIEAPVDTRLEGDREALITELRAQRDQAARDAETAADGGEPTLMPGGFVDPFKRT